MGCAPLNWVTRCLWSPFMRILCCWATYYHINRNNCHLFRLILWKPGEDSYIHEIYVNIKFDEFIRWVSQQEKRESMLKWRRGNKWKYFAQVLCLKKNNYFSFIFRKVFYVERLKCKDNEVYSMIYTELLANEFWRRISYQPTANLISQTQNQLFRPVATYQLKCKNSTEENLYGTQPWFTSVFDLSLMVVTSP